MNINEIAEIIKVLNVEYWELVLGACVIVSVWKLPDLIRSIKSDKKKDSDESKQIKG